MVRARTETQGTLHPRAKQGHKRYSQEPGLPETEAGAARRGRQSSS